MSKGLKRSLKDHYEEFEAAKAAIANLGGGGAVGLEDLQASVEALVNPVSVTTFTVDPTGPLEVGDTLTQVKFDWVIANFDGVKSAKIRDTSANTDVQPVTTASGSYTKTGLSITKNVPGTQSYQIQCIDGNDKVVNSTSRTYNWYWAVYFGNSASASLDAAGVKALVTKELRSGKNGNYVCPAGNYKYIAYPKSWGTSTFKDYATGLGFDMEAPATVEITNDEGVSVEMYVYRSTNILASEFTIQVL